MCAVAGTLDSTGMLGGWRVLDTMAGTWGVLEDASAPPERRRRNICEMPDEMGRLCEVDGCMPGAAVNCRLLDGGLEPGEGGEAK